MSRLSEQYSDLLADLSHISRIYGGISTVLSSPYFHAAVVISLLCHNFWMSPGWWDLPIGVLPNLLGFTLGGYAILLAFGDGDFKDLISGSTDEQPSAYLGASATFAHFIFVQVIALMLAILAKASVFSGVSCMVAGAINDIVDLDIISYTIWGCFLLRSLTLYLY